MPDVRRDDHRDTSRAESVIRTERLTKYYGARRVVDGLSLHVPRGCVYGLLGRNGAGKSTTIKMLVGLVHPDAGSIELLGHDASALDPAVRTRIAYVAENHPLYGWMSVKEIVRFTRSFYPHWNDELVDDILRQFRIAPDKKVKHLSNGQRAQLSLAIGVGPDPELLILDDPTLGVDAFVRREFLESLIEIIQREGRTILFSSHILGDVERVADRVGIMVDGVLRVDCPTEHFKSEVRKVVLGFSGVIPELPPCPGLVYASTRRGKLELVIVGYGDAQQTLLESLEPVSLDVLEMGLEDAFIEYTRDPAPGAIAPLHRTPTGGLA